MIQKRKVKTGAITLFLTAALWGCSARNEAQAIQQESSQPAPTASISTIQQKESQVSQQETSHSWQKNSDEESKAKSETELDIDQKAANNKANHSEKPQNQSGFDTPEEAVKAYLAGLRDNDLEQMADTFWDESEADNISRQYAILCGIDLIPEISSDKYLIIKESQDIQKLMNKLEQQIKTTDFSDMELRGFIPLEKLTDIYRSEPYQKNLAALAKKNGGNQLDTRMAVIRINKDSFSLLFDIIQYEDKWYIFKIGGMLSHILGLDIEMAGTLRLDTEDEKIIKDIINNTSEELPKWKETATRPKTESEGFATPQQAAIAFLDGLKAQDWEQMLGTFSVESYAEHYDLQAYTEYTQTYVYMKQDVSLPAVNEFVKAIVIRDRKKKVEKSIRQQGKGLYFSSKYTKGQAPMQEDTFHEWEDITEKMALESINVLGVITDDAVDKLVGADIIEKMRDNLAPQKAALLGADQIKDCIIVYECEGESYLLFMETASYDGKWYNNEIGNGIATALGIPIEYVGAVPIELIGNEEEVREMMESFHETSIAAGYILKKFVKQSPL